MLLVRHDICMYMCRLGRRLVWMRRTLRDLIKVYPPHPILCVTQLGVEQPLSVLLVK